jgi:hypothetical protein
MSVVRQNGAMWWKQRSRDVAGAVCIAPSLRDAGCSGSARGVHAILLALLVGVVMLAWPVAASALPSKHHIDAPGLVSGPFITSRGLAWESRRGVMLTSAAGRSTVLAPSDAPNWDGFDDLAWFGQNWWALARPSGVFAGRIGGTLHELPSLRKCNPGSPTIPPDFATYAVSDGHLYAALPEHCLPPRGAPREVVVMAIDLRSRRSHMLARIPGSLGELAASGKYLALAYWRRSRSSTEPSPNSATQQPRLLVRVLNASTGALISQVVSPPSTPASEPRNVSGIQVDNHGDILVTSESGAPGELAHIAQPFMPPPVWWWARAGSTVGHEIPLGRDAVLSEGRVAFFSREGGDRNGAPIVVKDLLDGATRTVVAFSGSVSATRLALYGSRLAWVQQSTVISVVSSETARGRFYSCTPVPLSPVELAGLELRDLPSSPVVVTGAPIPPQYANEPVCVVR